MTYEYWMIKRVSDGAYASQSWCNNTWTTERFNAQRWRCKPLVEFYDYLRIWGGCKLVHVRIRPRSERLYLTDRLKAWEPVVKAAVGYMSTIGIVNGKLAEVAKACAALPPEHHP